MSDSVRLLEHPGVSIEEQDVSMVSPNLQMLTALVVGFANEGEDLVPMRFSDINSYLTSHGAPQTEAEYYSYAAVKEILDQQGNVIFAKLQYNNDSRDSYRAIGFTLSAAVTVPASGSMALSALFANADGSAISGMAIRPIDADEVTNNISSDELDALRTANNFSVVTNYSNHSFVIVNTSRDALTGQDENNGLFVMVLPAYNAIAWQNLAPFETTSAPYPGWALLDGVLLPNALSALGIQTNLTAPSGWVMAPSAIYTSDSIAKSIPREFPAILQTSEGVVDRTYLNQVVVLVLKTYTDTNNGDLLNYQLVEKFTGSLRSTDTDPTTKQSIFIGDKINSESNYIEFYFNTDDDSLIIDKNASVLYTIIRGGSGQLADTIHWPMLSFTSLETVKNIRYTDITSGLDYVYTNMTNIDANRLDVVVDAGLSNIAQYTYNHDNTPYSPAIWDSANDAITSRYDIEQWKTTCDAMISFCQNTRKDCMAILDAPRAIALEGNLKTVRPAKPENTIDASIIPKLKYMQGINSSYGAMYTTWMKVINAFTGNQIWIPESIKVIGRYCYTERVFNFWDAPYGLDKGLVAGVTDISFNPNSKQQDQIYLKNFNYAVDLPYEGVIVWGQKTLQSAPSAFDRVNVRRLFLKMERLTYDVARYFVSTLNNSYTRTRLLNTLDPKFANVERLGGLYDYKLVCDETNNTTEVIDNNELKLAVLLKPAHSADFILVKFVALRTGGSFSEVLV